MLEFGLEVSYDGDKKEIVEISLPSKLSEVALSTFSSFIIYRDSWDKIYIEYEEAGEDRKKAIQEELQSNQGWSKYLDNCAEGLCFFVAPDKNRWIYKLREQAEFQLLSIYYMLLGLLNSKSDLNNTFIYKDEIYLLPEAYTDRMGYTMPAYNSSLIEIIEGFQYEHFYNQKGENGAYYLSDRRKQTVQAQLAAMTRKIVEGTAEKYPLNEEERRRFMDKRIDYFSDVTLDIAFSLEQIIQEIKFKLDKHTQIGELFNNDPKTPEEAKIAIKSHAKWERWGWYTILQEISEGGAFKKDGLTPIESAMSANFWQCLFWLAHKADMSRI